MERLRGTDKGFTLLELVIAIALSAVVLLSASNLLINFGKFSTNVVKSEASLMGTSLGAFEGITLRITAANEVSFSSPIVGTTPQEYSTIAVRVSPTGSGTTSDHSNDTIHTYWKSGDKLKYKSKVGNNAESAESDIAGDITSLSFTKVANNEVKVDLKAQAASGPNNALSTEHLVTTAIMRSRSANLP